MDLIEEIKDDIRQERLETLWKRYGKYAIGAAAIIILGTGTGVWWKQHILAEKQASGTEYYLSLQYITSGDTPSAIQQLDALIKDYPNEPVAALAKLKKAAILQSEDKDKDAEELYGQLAADGKGPAYLVQLAGIIHAAMQLNSSPAVDSVTASLSKYTDPSAPWHLVATRISAALQLAANKPLDAQVLYESIKANAEAPHGTQAYAQELADALGGGVPAEVLKRHPAAAPAVAPTTSPSE